jgi:hypothetical protein
MKKLSVSRNVIWFAAVFLSAFMAQQAGTQRSGTEQDWEQFVKAPAVSGYEQKLAEKIRDLFTLAVRNVPTVSRRQFADFVLVFEFLDALFDRLCHCGSP